MGHCHCTMCRKFHGAAFATLGEALVDNFRWTRGEDSLQSYHAHNGTVRKFCKVCGSSMVFMSSSDDGTLIEFALGTLDSKIPHQPDAHIFLDYRANWTEINDDLPHYREGRSSTILDD